jgi:hypothetical protein
MVIPICSKGRFISPPKGLEAMRKSKANNLPMIGLSMLILAIMAGCVPAHFRAQPQLEEKVQSIHTVAIMPPSIKFYALSIGGNTQLMDEPTASAKQIVAAAIEKELGRHAGVVFKAFPSPSAILDTNSDLTAAGVKDELQDTQALFEAVSASVILHTYKPEDAPDQRFPEKLKNFDYSLGPEVERFAKLADADALLFVSGVDHISTGGRKAMMSGVAVLCTAGFLFNPIAAAMCLASLSGRAILSVALVDATTGALLWYNVNGGTSLTYPEYVADLAAQVFEDFPLGTRPTRNEYGRSDPSRIGGMN